MAVHNTTSISSIADLSALHKFPLCSEETGLVPVQHLSSGAFGSAFLCKTPKASLRVVKIATESTRDSTSFLLSASSTSTAASDIYRECEIVTEVLAGVDPSTSGYENIAQVLESNQTEQGEKLFYNVQEFGGENLAQRAYSGKKTGSTKKADYSILRQACQALQLMHNSGFGHFDIKPENLVVDSATGLLKVIDFGGVAKLAQGDFVGTPGFMPAEATTGKWTAANASKFDTFSLGVLMMLLRCPSSVGMFKANLGKPVTEKSLKFFLARGDLASTEVKLMQGMLHSDPTKRMSITQVLAFLDKNALGLERVVTEVEV